MSPFQSTSSRTFAAAFLTILLGFAALASVGPTQAEDKPANGRDASMWMKKKVEYSHRAFDGLATGDFEQIHDAAEHLRLLNKVESFVRGRTPAYRRHLENFEEANEEVLRQSDARNLEGVTLAFTQMTYSCVACHKELRKQ